jgi:hypothetical protein
LPSVVTELDDVDEQLDERVAAVLAKVADVPEVGLPVGGEEAKGDVALEQPVELPGAPDADGISEHEDFQEHDRVIPGSPSKVVAFLRVERFESALLVEIVENVRDKPFEAVLFDPVVDRFRQEVLLVLIVSDEVIRHR